jgi:4-carboxymuconolactone decarboxylase
MNKEPSAAQKMIGDFAPKLVELTDQVLFGDVWERPELSKRATGVWQPWRRWLR